MNLVTDRTADDVSRWLELKHKGLNGMTASEMTEWLNSKGAYNHTDLNRVEAAVSLIAEKLRDIGINVRVSTKSDWTRDDVPTASDLARYLDNVRALRNASTGLRFAPGLPGSMARLDYIGANSIEEVLAYVSEWADGMRNAQRYAGEFYGGEW